MKKIITLLLLSVLVTAASATKLELYFNKADAFFKRKKKKKKKAKLSLTSRA